MDRIEQNIQKEGLNPPSEANPPPRERSNLDEIVSELFKERLAALFSKTIRTIHDVDEVFSKAVLRTLIEGEMTLESYLSKIRPCKPAKIDPHACQKWIESHKESFKQIAEKLIEKMRCISFEEFRYQLKKSVEDFNHYLSEQSDRSYIIVIPGGFEKSSFWVTAQAKNFLKFPPEEVFMLDDPEFIKKIKGSTAKNCVMFDDGAYSGTQMTTLYIPKVSGWNKMIHLIIPYIAKSAEEKFNKIEEENAVRLASHQEMKAFSSYLTEEERDLLIREGHEQFRCEGVDPVITFFDHKMGDSFSMVQSIESGQTLYPSEISVPFVETIFPPYKYLT